jgi:hypothetical protein
MTYYVRRQKHDRIAWVGPLRTFRNASDEADAWRENGWSATIHASTPVIKIEVAIWEQEKKAKKKTRGEKP